MSVLVIDNLWQMIYNSAYHISNQSINKDSRNQKVKEKQLKRKLP